VASIISILLEIYFSPSSERIFLNPLRIDKIIDMSLVCYFFGEHGIGL